LIGPSCMAAVATGCAGTCAISLLRQAKPLKKPKKAAGELDEDDKAFLEKKKAEQVPPL
jgi:Translation machinery associated TMA7